LSIASGKSESEIASFPGLGFHPDAAPMAFHNLLANSQADACAGILAAAMQSLEQPKHGVPILWTDPDTVILYGKTPISICFLGRDSDLRDFGAAILDCVAN
jgi:hypothetical protein